MGESRRKIKIPLFYTLDFMSRQIVFSFPISIAYLILFIFLLFIGVLITIATATVFASSDTLIKIGNCFSVSVFLIDIVLILNFIFTAFNNQNIKFIQTLKHLCFILLILSLTVITNKNITSTINRHNIVMKKYESILKSRFETKLGIDYSRDELFKRYTKKEIDASFKKYYMSYGVEEKEPLVNTLELELGEFQLY